jgi:putative Mn2+ efflux pump MntP
MGTLALVAVTLGLDSARAAAALALHPAVEGRRARYALAFGAFDGLASLVGLLAGGRVVDALEPHIRIAGSLLLAAYGLWLVVEPFEWTPQGGLWLPATLSLDNLGAGLVLAGPVPVFPVAVFLGATSCMLAGFGFWAGELVRTRVPSYAERLSGVALLTIAIAQAAGVG